jgi:hypothetical protein
MKKVNLLPPSVKDLQFSRFLKNGEGPKYSSSDHCFV